MRIMVKFWVPAEAGNAAIRNGKLEKVFGQLLEDLKPEAGYFYPATANASSSASTPGLN